MFYYNAKLFDIILIKMLYHLDFFFYFYFTVEPNESKVFHFQRKQLTSTLQNKVDAQHYHNSNMAWIENCSGMN